MKLRATLPLAVLALPVLFAAATAHAATPTPTVTSTPAATATPSPQQIARFTGEKWADATFSSDIVTARIGDVVCGTEEVFACADCAPVYRINVVSDRITPGCGHEGATINFFVGDRQAPQTAVWHAGSSSTLNLTVGPPFALISGSTSLTCDQIIEHHIVPFVNGVACGDQRGGGLGPPCQGELATYADIVLSAQQQAGCGVEGAPITFKLLDTHGNVIATANENGLWHAWDGGVSSAQQLNLTFAPATSIHVGNVGDGPRGSHPWLRLSLALASLGLASGIGGLALRRRAAK